ncbi:helix-turn-helix transcriptional regulator [Sphingomonas sp. QA11]|uniref:helix-turn-helix transcriptional regulator n=1 Tax=Sphingomonas sp. QA11 TaxID=2950605 RepID=UPI003FA78154
MSLQLQSGLQIADVAARLRISATHFSKAFRNSVGLAPSRWYQRERIAKSMRLLRDGALELSEIASECGYFDESHYVRTFSRAVGIPPGRWRRKQMAIPCKEPLE